jgi:protoheme IX farnesyltransferase
MSQSRTRDLFLTAAGLVKLRLSLAVVLSSVTGYFLGRGSADIHLLFLAAGVFLLASGSAVLNQYTERGADALMERTRNRPIPSGRISLQGALAAACFLFTGGSIFLYINGLTALFLGLLTVVLYNFIYTWLKRVTILAIIPGALVGAIPPVIGFASAGGDYMHPAILGFSAFMFLWQLPHFWLIIIKYGKDYRSAGFPTLSSYLSELQIRYLVFGWVVFSTIYLFFFFLLSEALSTLFFIMFSVLNGVFILTFYRMLFSASSPRQIKSAFILINSFSLIVMLLLITLSILNIL